MSGPALEQAKAEAPTPLGVYVHVPFCASTCDFCAFYQTQPTADDIRRFLATIERETALVEWTGPVTTVFWGGGTPGLLAPRQLEKLAAIVRGRLDQKWHGSPDPCEHSLVGRPVPRQIEWTVELAPGSV